MEDKLIRNQIISSLAALEAKNLLFSESSTDIVVEPGLIRITLGGFLSNAERQFAGDKEGRKFLCKIYERKMEYISNAVNPDIRGTLNKSVRRIHVSLEPRTGDVLLDFALS